MAPTTSTSNYVTTTTTTTNTPGTQTSKPRSSTQAIIESTTAYIDEVTGFSTGTRAEADQDGVRRNLRNAIIITGIALIIIAIPFFAVCTALKCFSPGRFPRLEKFTENFSNGCAGLGLKCFQLYHRCFYCKTQVAPGQGGDAIPLTNRSPTSSTVQSILTSPSSPVLSQSSDMDCRDWNVGGRN